MGKDPAFLFYPADAAEDVSHMNRLERGCYFDIVQAQKKFGRLNLSLIKKILGHDFDGCWDSIKICLSYVDDMYFIEWLENSIEKRKAYSESRKNNRKGIKTQDMSNICESHDSTYVEHMGNENRNENKDRIEDREIEFINQVNLYTDYPQPMRDDFIRYWTEKNPNGKKMKFEMQKTFEISKRLVTWNRNNFGNKNQQPTFYEREL